MGGSSKDCQLIVFKVLCTQQTSGMERIHVIAFNEADSSSDPNNKFD
jgi:hypothetical protein